jgi:uncharacterized GH25 family protein
MKIRTAISMLILFSLTQVAFAQTAAEKISTASISGRVTVGDKPVPNALVTLNDQNYYYAREGLGAKTDEDGNYKFTNVKAGRYSISVKALAYVLPNANQYSPAVSVIIGADEIIDKQDFQLKPGGVITGKIVDSEGRPVIEQRINLSTKEPNVPGLRPLQNSNSTQSNVTDDRGIYRIFGLPAGKYFVSVGVDPKKGVENPGSNKLYPLTFYPSVASDEKAEIVEVAEGSEVKNIDITVGKASQLFQAKGRIVDAVSGQPMVAVRLFYGNLVKEGNRDRVANWTTRGEITNAKGEFNISGLAPSMYGITMRQEEGYEYFAETTNFEISASDVENIEIKAHSGASISGIVILEGEKNPAVLAQLKALRVSYSIENNSNQLSSNPPLIKVDGTFQLSGLRPGKARLYVTVYNAAPDFVLLRAEKDGIVLPAVFEVMEKAKITGIRLVVGYAGGSISGQINITGGTLPPNTFPNVYARMLNPPQPNFGAKGAQVSANGKFVIDKMLPGEYEINVNPPYVPNQPIRAKAVKQKVTVTNNVEATVTLNLDLTPEGGQQ